MEGIAIIINANLKAFFELSFDIDKYKITPKKSKVAKLKKNVQSVYA
jgi:hypothetical protein